MRKYYQAALAIVAIVSLVALVFYRHEYNRLRYVLEVFDYFGRPGGNVGNRMGDGALPIAIDKSHHYTVGKEKFSLGYFKSSDFDEPIPSWHRLNDEIYVYSAYRTDNVDKIIAVGFIKRNAKIPLSCGIFYENDVKPTPGIFTYRKIPSVKSSRENENSDGEAYSGYQFICKYTMKENRMIIAGVKFTVESQSEGKDSSILLPVRETSATTIERGTDGDYAAICILPTERPVTDREMIDFLSFHILLGTDHFIVYDSGIAPRFNSILNRMINRHNTIVGSTNVTYTTLPWNFPFTEEISHDIVRSIVQADCLRRTYKKVGVVATLTWNEYIILKYHRNIVKLFRDIDETHDPVSAADRYSISARNFCVDKTEQNTSPLILGNEKIIDDEHPVIVYRLRINMSLDNEPLAASHLSTDLIIANRYEDHCDFGKKLEVIPLDDRYVGKFSKSALNSAMTKLFHQYAR